MKMALTQRQPRTHDTESFYFEPEQPLAYTSGQFLCWNLPHADADDRGEKRFFSISSSPTEPRIMLTTKFSDPGSSFKRALKQLAIGSVLEATGPSGDFVLAADPALPIVMVAGGVGITPFRSMLKYLADSNTNTPVHLLYACRSDQDRLFDSELDEWAATRPTIRLTYVLGQAPAGWQGETGNLTAERILALTSELANAQIYLSGPEPMIKALKEQLVSAGVSEERLKTDYFPGYMEA